MKKKIKIDKMWMIIGIVGLLVVGGVGSNIIFSTEEISDGTLSQEQMNSNVINNPTRTCYFLKSSIVVGENIDESHCNIGCKANYYEKCKIERITNGMVHCNCWSIK